MYLDVYNMIASLPIGYNNPEMLKHLGTPEVTSLLANRPALGIIPPKEYADAVAGVIRAAAPPGLNKVGFQQCGSCANENAIKLVFMRHMAKKRAGRPFSEEEFASCMLNRGPGTPPLAILSFSGGFHGRTMGLLSTTHSKPIHKVDIPVFPWPTARFPKLKYPLDKHEAENRAEEQRCIDEVESIIRTSPLTIAGLIVEPVQAEGGDNHASPWFFRQLRKLTERMDVAMIVDEVQTGVGPTGTFWNHEQWGLESPPDLVTFAKKLQISGYFMRDEFMPREAYRVFNTWCGEPVRLIQARFIAEYVRKNNLMELAKESGAVLRAGLDRFAKQGSILNVRGTGTFLAFDFVNAATRDSFVKTMRSIGVNMGGCGFEAVRIRPMMTFTPKHAEVFVAKMEEGLKLMPK
jgi:4-aminobutyrate aminotransferase/(S)-3-amino-2-methylpropionate transaminase